MKITCQFELDNATSCTSKHDGAPPAFLEPVESKTLSVAETSNVTLKCRATGHPAPSYWWKRDGRRIPGCSDSGDLTLTNVSSQHKGDYQCVAENEDTYGVIAVATSQPITLNIYSQCKAWKKSINSRFVRQEYQHLALECDCPPECLKSKVTWYRYEPALARVDISRYQGRLHIDKKGTLHFIYTSASDGSTTYQCGVTTSNQLLLGKKYEVTITKVTVPPAHPSRIRFQTVQSRFLLHQTADLECVFSGHPTPVTTWKYINGTTLPHSGKFELVHGSFGRRLRIRNLAIDDGGRYICSGTNGVTDDAFVDVTVASKPVWVKPLIDITVPEGRVAHLCCKTDSVGGESQAGFPTWYKNGNEINPANIGDRRFQFSKDRSVLTIVKVKRSVDAVCFQCNVSNSAGYVFGNGCLKVTKGNRGPVTVSKTTILIAAVCSASLVILAVIFTIFIRRIWKKTWKSDVSTRRSSLPVYTDIEYRQGTPPPPYDQIHLQCLPRDWEVLDDDRDNTSIYDYTESGSDARNYPSVVSQGGMYLTPSEGADDPPPYLSLI
ncbi:neural cell adhesion molecule L1-like [Haliotis asinina]|uniref:neural cell adhesion molecule L1-like n=1 Tax=Haliotis asinina TaxID=109174 RepID=UPI0035325FC4